MIPKFYYSPGACSLAPHICLEEVGAQVEYERVDFARGQQHAPQFLELNPNARVPLLLTERGALTEAAAIMTWVALTWPEARLTPANDPWAVAQVDSFCSFLTSSLHAAAYASVFRPGRFSDDVAAHPAIKAKGLATLKGLLAQVEARLEPGAWIQGDYTICDPYLFVMVRWFVRLGEDLAVYPRIAAHAQRMLERPAVQRALDHEGVIFG